MLARTLALAALTLSGSIALSAGNVEPVLRVYDTRDLAAALPSGNPSPGILTILPRFESSGPDGGLLRLGVSGPAPSKDAAAVSPADLVVSRLCEQLSLQKEALVEGVYLITGEDAQHEQFVKLLEDVRSLYQGAYELEILVYPAPAAQAPAIGSDAEPQSVTIRTRQVIGRRVESRIAVTEEISYIRDWQPVVGNESVGYDPDPGTVTKGLRLIVTAGGVEHAAPEPARRTGRPASEADAPQSVVSLRLSGSLTDAVVEKQSSPLAPLSGGSLELGLPRLSTRTIESDLRIVPGRTTVLAVVPGTKPGDTLVIAGTLRELR